MNLAMNYKLIETPSLSSVTFLNFPLVTNLETLDADLAILGIPLGNPYKASEMANDQSRAPDAIRHFLSMPDIEYSRNHYDYDLGGPVLDGRDIKVVDCGNVTGGK
jgi:agmatinase